VRRCCCLEPWRSSAGPLLGGLLIAAFGWRAIFLVNVPIVLLALPAAAGLLAESTESAAGRLDLAGVALAVSFLAALTAGFIEAGRAGLGSLAAIALLAAAAILAPAFVVVERSRGAVAMLPVGLFRTRGFSASNAAAAAMNLGTLGTLFVLTLFLQQVQGRSPLEAGTALPLFAPLAVIAPLAGRQVGRVGPVRPMAIGLVVSAAGLGLLAFAGPGSGYPALSRSAPPASTSSRRRFARRLPTLGPAAQIGQPGCR
jgi:MFS transporter, DHA2 family, methylenomycin A resistance protein